MKKSFFFTKYGLYLIAIIAGLISSFGYAPYNLWFLPLIGLTLLSCVLVKHNTKSTVFSIFLFSISLNLSSLWWITSVLEGFGQMPFFLSTLIIVLLSAYLGIFHSLAAYLSSITRFGKFAQLVFFLPFFWVGADYINGYLFTGFPWNWLCYTQLDSVLKFFAPVLGAESVTLVLLMISGALGYAIMRFRLSTLCLPIILFAIATWLSTIEHTNKLSPVNVALMQGNIATEVKWNPEQIVPTLKTYFKLIEDNLDADIIIWPESAIPALENDTFSIINKLDNLMYSNQIGFITGVQYFDEENNAFYNGMIGLGYIDNKGLKHYVYGHGNRYYKRHLVPIGEFVSFEQLLKTLGPIFNMPMNSFTRGDKNQENIEIAGLKVASAICYEIVFNYELIDQIKTDTNMIVTLSQDGWFNLTNGPKQHLAIAQMRALEFSKPVLRSTNNGITATIDAKGNIIDKAPENKVFALRSTVNPTKGTTPFAVYGRLPILCIILFLLSISLIPKFYRLFLNKIWHNFKNSNKINNKNMDKEYTQQR